MILAEQYYEEQMKTLLKLVQMCEMIQSFLVLHWYYTVWYCTGTALVSQ